MSYLGSVSSDRPTSRRLRSREGGAEAVTPSFNSATVVHVGRGHCNSSSSCKYRSPAVGTTVTSNASLLPISSDLEVLGKVPAAASAVANTGNEVTPVLVLALSSSSRVVVVVVVVVVLVVVVVVVVGVGVVIKNGYGSSHLVRDSRFDPGPLCSHGGTAD